MHNSDLVNNRKWLLEAIRQSFTHKILIVSTLLALVYSLTIPFATQAIIDRVIAHFGYATLYTITIAISAMGVLEALSVTLRSVVGGFLANKFSSELARELIDNLARTQSSALLGRNGLIRAHVVDEVNVFRQDYMDLVNYFYQSLIPVLFFAIVMFLISPAMSCIVLLTIPVYYLAYRLIKRPGKRYTQTAVRLHSESSAAVHTMIGAIETVKSYGLSQLFSQNISRLVDRAFYAGYQTAKQMAIWQGVSRSCNALAQALILFVGAKSVMDNHLTLGQLISFQMFAGRLLDPITRAGVMLERWQRMGVHLDKWETQLREAKPQARQLDAAPDLQAPVLAMRAVDFQYESANLRQLQGIDLTIAAGEFVFLLGPSGSGKSTLVRLATGLLTPTAGSVAIAGNEISQVSETTRRHLVAAAFQEPVLLPGTIRDNISGFSRDATVDLDRIMAIAGVDQIVRKRPAGLDTDLGERSMPLSGGERQRVCLARLLACAPSLLIIDEGTSGLQRSLEISVLQSIKANLLPHQAVLVITHREDLTSIGTREIRIDDGAIQRDGGPRQSAGGLIQSR
ncbi:ATP-binding cassette domain-containing protein [Rugamonas sp. A1-17]|nr:ATP-binding cassette domain-containing protein [Rugamonas sp. A1-17]